MTEPRMHRRRKMPSSSLTPAQLADLVARLRVVDSTLAELRGPTIRQDRDTIYEAIAALDGLRRDLSINETCPQCWHVYPAPTALAESVTCGACGFLRRFASAHQDARILTEGAIVIDSHSRITIEHFQTSGMTFADLRRLAEDRVLTAAALIQEQRKDTSDD